MDAVWFNNIFFNWRCCQRQSLFCSTLQPRQSVDLSEKFKPDLVNSSAYQNILSFIWIHFTLPHVRVHVHPSVITSLSCQLLEWFSTVILQYWSKYWYQGVWFRIVYGLIVFTFIKFSACILAIGTALANSVESDLGCTSRVYYDNVALSSHKVPMTSEIPCQYNNKFNCSETNGYNKFITCRCAGSEIKTCNKIDRPFAPVVATTSWWLHFSAQVVA